MKSPALRLTIIAYLLLYPLLSLSNLLIQKYSVRKLKDELLSDEYKMKILAQTGEYQEDVKGAVFANQTVEAPKEPLAQASKDVLAAVYAAGEEKWIEIDLSEQRLKAWEGDRLVYDFLVSTGLWGWTPTGEFRIWTKLKYTLMAGGSTALGTYYYLPNVPYTQYFYAGYGLHGTYWHNNFGHPMSHGCVNMYTPEAEKLFYWTHPVISTDQASAWPTKDDLGTRVVVHD